jgi:diaminohydroxyphosphoribosylaminopyrimidine deaminase/5-amino-6-(5-phosphoribosylamino)uracil reductase
MTEFSDERFMREALNQARKGLGRTSPNPAVGAAIVRDGKVLATGYHHKAGAPHAEVEALSRMKGTAFEHGDTLYVTLEPCHHKGRTPPCTKAIVSSGLRRVVVGALDPNPQVTGGGCAYLESRGIEVKTGVLEKECTKLIEAFVKHSTTGRPFVIAKSASTLDGWTATGSGHSRWVTNELSRGFVHRLRDKVDAILVGVGTILADDPSLTTRLKNRKGKDPIRVIADTHFRTPAGARVLHQNSEAETILAVGEGLPEDRLEAITCLDNVKALLCPTDENGLDPVSLMDMLGEMDITSLLVEGGAALMGSLIRRRLIDKYYMFHGPKLLGGNDGIPVASGPGPEAMDGCLLLGDIRVRRFGDDVLIRGYAVHGN